MRDHSWRGCVDSGAVEKVGPCVRKVNVTPSVLSDLSCLQEIENLRPLFTESRSGTFVAGDVYNSVDGGESLGDPWFSIGESKFSKSEVGFTIQTPRPEELFIL